MKTIKIAGVSVNKEQLKKIDVEELVAKAKKTPQYRWKPNAEELINEELKKHGLRRKDIKKDTTGKSQGDAESKDTGTGKGNSSKGKESVGEGDKA